LDWEKGGGAAASTKLEAILKIAAARQILTGKTVKIIMATFNSGEN